MSWSRSVVSLYAENGVTTFRAGSAGSVRRPSADGISVNGCIATAYRRHYRQQQSVDRGNPASSDGGYASLDNLTQAKARRRTMERDVALEHGKEALGIG